VRVAIPLLTLLAILSAAPPPPNLDEAGLAAVHAQRLEWAKQRAGGSPLGVYQDFRAVFTHTQGTRVETLKAARDAQVQIVLSDGSTRNAPELEGGVLFMAPPAGAAEIYLRPLEPVNLGALFKQYPDEMFGAATVAQPDLLSRWDRITAAGSVTGMAWSDAPAGVSQAIAFRNTSTHILAPELSEAQIRTSLAQGRAYVAHDWLCDPTGFTFIAANFLGVFDMGDAVPIGFVAGATRLQAFLPVRARIKLIHNGAVVAEANDSKITYEAKEQGAYRLEAWLTAGGEDRPWILSNPIYLRGTANVVLPPADTPPSVELRGDITYTDGAPADEAKHKLDLFLPKGRTNFPVMLFLHGGSWRTGDRSLYRALGNHFASLGIAVAIPSYRLMPANPHPAQIEDTAAAFAWVYKNIGQVGGDVKRIYVTGHSAGGHLAALLALDHEYLNRLGIPDGAIRGVVSMSGVYDVSDLGEFVSSSDKHKASPIAYTSTPGAPPFLITYCQWDYLGLPKEARDLGEALKKSGVNQQMLYITGETHISEIISAVKEGSPLERAILSFIH
jgi:acetyl esterase/lipase